jgi:Ran GTPase-activating protein (RanGAP) involved in mRNA processing and transport
VKRHPKEEHKVKEFLGSSSKDYQGLIHKTSGDLRLVKAPAIDIIKLAKAIKDNNENRVLDLSFNEIGDKGILEVALALKGNKTIQSLSLAATKIGNSGDGGLAVIGSLSDILKNSPLGSLDLSFNMLGTQSLFFLYQYLQGKSTITQLNLSAVKVDYEGLANITCLVATLPNIKKLSLSDSSITEGRWTGLNRLIETRKTLTSLDLSYNPINIDSLKDMSVKLKFNTTLSNLKLSFTSEKLGEDFNAPKKPGKYIQELIESPGIEIVQKTDVFYLTPTVVKDSILAIGVTKVYHHGFDN